MLKSIAAKITLISSIHITLFNTKKATICMEKPSHMLTIRKKTIIQTIFIKTIIVFNQINKHKTENNQPLLYIHISNYPLLYIQINTQNNYLKKYT